MSEEKSVDDILVEKGLLAATDLRTAQLKALSKNLSLMEVLVTDGYVSDEALAEAMAERHKIERADLANLVIPAEIVALLPEAVIRKHRALPLSVEGDVLTIAIHDPAARPHLEKLRGNIKKRLTFKIAAFHQLNEQIERAIGTDPSVVTPMVAPSADKASDRAIALDDGVKLGAEAIVNQMIESCARQRASDIHVEPEDPIVRVRARIDGILTEVATYKIESHPQIVSRLKVMAGLDIAEKRNAQDGSFQLEIGETTYDLRLSTLPTVRGEKAVLRILDKSILKVSLDGLGLSPSMLEQLTRILDAPHGLVLVTGPTGSGKTTTVYSMLNQINSMENNTITVEDPVEYQLPLINQVQVNTKAGLNFAGVLRNILRQDPDTIMIGEIRDRETADLAVRAALTGHLVISTIHTNDSVSTISRLMDMGIEPFLLSAALAGVVSQRLVRLLCPKCKSAQTLESADLTAISRAFANLDSATVYTAKGCPECNNAGYLGRQPIFELLAPTPQIRKLISASVSADALLEALNAQGFTSMRNDGIARVLAGKTSLDEVLRATI